MAYQTTSIYKEKVYNEDAKHKLKILFNGVEYPNIDNVCEKLTINSRIIPNGNTNFALDNFISKEATLILHNVALEDIVDKVEIQIGTLTGSDSLGDIYEYVPIGIFNIQDIPTTDKDKTTITLRDNAVKFDFPYNAEPLIEGNGGSATKMQIFQDICTQAGVGTNVNSFLKDDELFGGYDNTISGRQYIAYLAEQAGAIAIINRYGNLDFIYLNNLEEQEIPLQYVEKYENGDPLEISKVIYESGKIKYEYGNDNKDTLFLDASNPYINDIGVNKNISGEEIIIEDNKENFKSFTKDGKCEQLTFGGKNKLDLLTLFTNKFGGITTTDRGITFEINEDGKVHLSGTATSTAQAIIGTWSGTTPLIELDSSKTYTLKVFGHLKNGSTVMLGADVRGVKGGTVTKIIYGSDSGDYATFSGFNSITYIDLYTQYTGGTTDGTLYIQLEEGNEPTEYEKYVGGIPSPNPSYPQNIESISGINLFDGNIDNGRWSFTVGQTISPNTQIGFRNSNAIKIKPNTKYVISSTFTQSGTVFFVETDKDNKVLAIDGNNGYKEYIHTVGINSKMILTTHNQAKNLYWHCVFDITRPIDFMVYENSNQKYYINEYIPYNNLLIENIGSKNLLKGDGYATNKSDINYWENISSSYITSLENGFCNVNIDNSSGSGNAFCNMRIRPTQFEKLKPSANYTAFVEIRNVEKTGDATFVLHQLDGTSGSLWLPTTQKGAVNISNTIIRFNFNVNNDLNGVNAIFRSYVRAYPNSKIKCDLRLSIFEGNVSQEEFEYQMYNKKRTLINLSKENLYDSSFRASDNTIYTPSGTVTESNGVFSYTPARSDAYIWEIGTQNTNYNPNSNGKLYEFDDETYSVKISNPLFNKNYITYYDENKVSLGYTRFYNSFAFNKSDKQNAKYFSIRIGYGSAISGTTYNFSVTLYKGEDATTPYYELCSINDTKDEIIIDNGHAKLIKRIGKLVLNGSENWTIMTTQTTQKKIFSLDNRPSINCFEKTLVGNTGYEKYDLFFKSNYGMTGYQTLDNGQYGVTVAYGVRGNDNNVDANNGGTIAQWQNLLSNNNLIIYGILKYPYEVDLGECEIDVFEGYNNIYIENILQSNMSIKYVSNKPQIEYIYDILNGFKINSFKTGKILGNPAIDPYDIISLNDGENTYKTLATNTLIYNGKLIQTFDTQVKIGNKQSNVSLMGEPNFQKYARENIDNINNNIETIVAKQNETTQQMSQVIQTVNSIQNTFQVTGGNNLIKDSQGLLGDDVWTKQDGGNYVMGYDASLIGKTIAYAKLGVNNGKLTSTSENITGLVVGMQYTLSYKISNDANTTTKVKLTGNNVVYDDTISDEIGFIEKSFSFIADTSTYTLEIESATTMDGYGYIYDLMLNKGDALSWEPASGEIVGTVLKMSQMGLQINCTGSDIATLMTSQGFQVRRYSNGTLYEIVTEFTSSGLKTKKAEMTELIINNFEWKQIMYQGNDTLILYKKESD